MAGKLIDAARTARPAAEVQGAVQAHRAQYADAASAGPARAGVHARTTAQYYDLVTDFYEYGWGQSFHFAVRTRGDTLQSAIDRHEDWIAHESGLCPGQRALDLGCGVGGPMRYLARRTGAHITGVNLNDTQLERARSRAAKAGLAAQTALVKADFASVPFEARSFDAVYAIEATCHAEDRRRVFAEAFRVLVPGGRFVGYEWCSTRKLDPSDAEHLRVLHAIAEGNALPSVTPTTAVDEALTAAGFVLREGRDVALDCDPQTPWWMALDGEGGLRAWPRTPAGRAITTALVNALERVRLAPRGASEVSALLNLAADALVEGGRLGIFTPMYRFSAGKPA